MANKVTSEDIMRINEIYYKTHTYAETARQTGFSAGTVKKYVVHGWKPVVAENVKRFSLSELPELDFSIFAGVKNYGELCILSEQENCEMEELWKELTI